MTLDVTDNTFFQTFRSVTLSGNGPGAYYLPFALWGSVAFDQIGAISLRMPVGNTPNNGPGVYRFESLVAVPESRAYALVFGIGLIGYGAFLRGRRSWK
jgi:hypothetical protein